MSASSQPAGHDPAVNSGNKRAADLSAAVRAVLRWLPTKQPAGAFAGQHDRVHLPKQELHARVNLWWSEDVVHPGQTVGPPRGGLVPGRTPTYSIALPAGGFLWVEDGVLTKWHESALPDWPMVRADGEVFEPNRYSTSNPYFTRHYRRMTIPSIETALASGSTEDLSQVVRGIAEAGEPVLCDCTGQTPTSPAPTTGWAIPDSLLSDAATLRVLVGQSGPEESVATLWRLSDEIWDPAQVGRAMAADAVARQAGERATEFPQSPVTETAVAQVAAQALRWHGQAVIRTMPAWLLGWIMVARPLLIDQQRSDQVVSTALELADRVRLARVETQWHAMAAARLLISRSAAHLVAMDNSVDSASVWDLLAMSQTVDLRDLNAGERPDAASELVSGYPLRDLVQRAYRCDTRSWVGLAAQQ